MSINPLAQRIATAAVLVAICLPPVLFLPLAVSHALLGVFVGVGAWEWSAFAAHSQRIFRFAYTGAILVAIVLFATVNVTPGAVIMLVKASLLWWLIAFVWILRFPTRIGRITVMICGFLVLVPAWISLDTLLSQRPMGRSLFLMTLAIVWAADVGAYFAGRLWGRVKLAPSVSPGKTWEGVFGGLVLAALTSMAGASLLGYPVPVAVPLGLSVAAISIVGDLTISMFKRNAGLKDSGHLFPGHGGMLDRVDSVTAAAPLFLLEASWLGWVTL
jgi:phosphatidate cytidylyltransferase